MKISYLLIESSNYLYYTEKIKRGFVPPDQLKLEVRILNERRTRSGGFDPDEVKKETIRGQSGLKGASTPNS